MTALVPTTRAEARKVLDQPIRDVEYARLAASYLGLLDALGTVVGGAAVDLLLAAAADRV